MCAIAECASFGGLCGITAVAWGRPTSPPIVVSSFCRWPQERERDIYTQMESRILSIQSHVVSGYVGNKAYGISRQ